MQTLLHLETVCLLCINALTYKHNMQLVSNNFYFLIFNGIYFVSKIVLTYCEKKKSSDREKLLKFEVEGGEFAKFLRSLEQHLVKQ